MPRKKTRTEATLDGGSFVPPLDLRWIQKQQLQLDPAYQRDQTASKVANIRDHWDWSAVGALRVAERPNKALFVYDGGHRLQAALERVDVSHLPCVIFTPERSAQAEEADAFVKSNTVTAVRAYNKHVAGLVCKDPLALQVQALLDKHGLQAAKQAKKSTRSPKFAGLVHLQEIVKKAPEIADAALGLCKALVDADAKATKSAGPTIPGDLLKGFAYLMEKEGVGQVLTDTRKKRLLGLGLAATYARVRQHTLEVGQRGNRDYAVGIAKILAVRGTRPVFARIFEPA